METRLKVENFKSTRSGREVVNQFRIFTNEGVYFQSYQTVIAFKPYGGGKIVLDENSWDYSVTTSKYRNEFLRENKKETEQAIKAGRHILADLNG